MSTVHIWAEAAIAQPNHGGRSVTSRYIKTSYLGRMLAAAQEDISAHLVQGIRLAERAGVIAALSP